MYELTWLQYKKTRRPCCGSACEECPYKKSMFGHTSLKLKVSGVVDHFALENSRDRDFEEKYLDSDNIVSRLKEKTQIRKKDEKQLKTDFEKYFHARIDRENVTHFL